MKDVAFWRIFMWLYVYLSKKMLVFSRRLKIRVETHLKWKPRDLLVKLYENIINFLKIKDIYNGIVKRIKVKSWERLSFSRIKNILTNRKGCIESHSFNKITASHHLLHFIITCQHPQNIKTKPNYSRSLHLSLSNQLFSFPLLFIHSSEPLTPLLSYSSFFISSQSNPEFPIQTINSAQSTAPFTQLSLFTTPLSDPFQKIPSSLLFPIFQLHRHF